MRHVASVCRLVSKVYDYELSSWRTRKYSKGKWQQKFLLAHLKETPKRYREVYYRTSIPALFGEIF